MSIELRQALEQVARRFRRVRLWGGLALCWLTWAFLGWGLAALLSRTGQGPLPIPLPITGRWMLGAFAALATATGLACVTWALRSARDPRWVARRIEAEHPELGTGLLAAVEQDANAPDGRLGYLQASVVREALEHSWTHNWADTVSTRKLLGTQVVAAAALALLIVASTALVGQARTRIGGKASLARGDGGDAFDVKVDPGNTEIERGASLLVVARFKGAVPADASLVVSDSNSGNNTNGSGGDPRADSRRGMTRSLEDPTFAGRIESVDANLTYRVAFEDRTTETFRVRVFEYPELERTDARLDFPRYTAIEPKTVEDIRHVTAVEGTELTLLCRLNKDVAVARLVDAKGGVIALTPRDEDGPHTYRASLTLADSRRYKVQLVDREGRPNKSTPEIVLNVTRNRPAIVKMTQPARDVRVSPVEELMLKADVEDDFGLVRHGLGYSVGGEEPREVVLKGDEPASKKVKAQHMLDFEALRAVPDQLVTYFFWADDFGPDGKPRRTSGDMFFAEVRHFEEVFRQGEPPPGGSSQGEEQQGDNARDSNKLAELQKEIINGTWKLIRRETGVKPSEKFVEDSEVLRESQRSAIEQAAALAEKLRDATSKANLEQASRFMKDAVKHLAEAARVASVAAHRPALVAEQAAYQALLKLRAREFEVTRNNARQRQQGSRGSAGSPSQRQLQQLELSEEENRYEEQRSARPPQENLTQRAKEQQETRQVVSRLRELAQRQTDLNDRLKELQSALEAAKDPQARAEIEKQLKRLRDQQQQILRDTDELQERMEREENRERMAEARERIEQGREHVRQASEALEEGRLPQALNEGARAGRQLDELREELRKDASNRFSEEMTEMRDQARRLDEDQKKLSEQIDDWNKRPQRSLRDTKERAEAKQGLEQQRDRLDQVLDRARRTVQDAEETEPLLAKELFDTVRKANEQAIPNALKDAEQLVDVGVPEEAVRSSRRAGQGIEQLREGVERAAESVLGDETAALKRAQGELENLADQVNRELDQATGRQTADAGRAPSRPSTGQARRGEGEDARGQQGDQAQDPQQGAQPGQEDPQGQPGQQGQPKGKGQQKGQQGQGQQKGQQGQQGQGQQGGQPGQQGEPGQQGGQRGQGGGLRGGNAPQQKGRQAGSPRGGGGVGDPSGLDQLLEGRGGGPGGPVTGDGFRQWSDRMRDVEELLNDPEMRSEAARIRDRVRGEREEFRRHSKEPDWTKLKDMVADPIAQLRDRVAEEVRRRESPDALVPIDRDPVPPRFAEGVRRYYERLGSGQ